MTAPRSSWAAQHLAVSPGDRAVVSRPGGCRGFPRWAEQRGGFAMEQHTIGRINGSFAPAPPAAVPARPPATIAGTYTGRILVPLGPLRWHTALFYDS
jgi:hypothetical protein